MKTLNEIRSRIFELSGKKFSAEHTYKIWLRYNQLIQTELFTPIVKLMDEAIRECIQTDQFSYCTDCDELFTEDELIVKWNVGRPEDMCCPSCGEVDTLI